MEENIKTIENFLKRAEDQAAASLLASDTEIQDSEELPMTEIREDLNEEGNVICAFYTLFTHIPNLTPYSQLNYNPERYPTQIFRHITQGRCGAPRASHWLDRTSKGET